MPTPKSLAHAEFSNRNYGEYGNHYIFKLIVHENSYDSINNTSNCTFNVTNQADSQSYGNFGYNNPAVLFIDGIQVASNNIVTDYRNMKVNTLLSFTKNIEHNNNGEKVINVKASFSSESPHVSGSSASGDVTLTKIDREAKIIEAINFTDEGEPKLTYNNPANYTVNALLIFGNNSIARNNITGNGTYSFILTDNERNLLRSSTPDSYKLAVKYQLDTNIGGTMFHNSLVKEMNIINADPVLDSSYVTYKSENLIAITGNNQKVIKGYSDITVSISSSAITKKYATLKNSAYVFESRNKPTVYANQSGAFPKVATFTKQEFAEYTVKVIDSRGNQNGTGLIKTVDFIDYVEAKLNSIKIERGNNNTSKEFYIEFTGSYTDWVNLKVPNAVDVKYKLTILGETTPTAYTNIPLSKNTGGVFERTRFKIFDVPVDKKASIDIVISDKIYNSADINILLNDARPFLSLHNIDHRIGVGCIPDVNNIKDSVQLQGEYATLKQQDGTEKVVSVWKVVRR